VRGRGRVRGRVGGRGGGGGGGQAISRRDLVILVWR